MELFTYLMAKNDHNTSVKKDLFSYLLGKNQSGTYTDYSGTSLSINNTKKAKMEVNLLGNTSQTGTPTPDNPEQVHTCSGDNEVVVCGKNLFDKDIITTGKTYTSTGGISNLASSFVQETYISVLPNTAYTLSTTNDYSSIIPGEYRLVLCEYNSSKSFIQRNLGAYDTHNVFTITTTANTYYLRVCASNLTLDELQLEKGSTPTPYEPYQSSTYPIHLGTYELCKIGTYQDKFIRNSGKNLLPNEATTATIQGCTFTINEGKTISVNGTSTGWTGLTISTITLQAGTYTLSSGLEGTSAYNLFLETSGGISKNTTYGDNTFTINEEMTLTIKLFARPNYAISNFVVLPMIFEGSTALPYEPYGNGDLYLEKHIGKYTFDGTEEYLQYSSTTKFFTMLNDALFTSGISIVCNKYLGKTSGSGGDSYDNYTTWLQDTSTYKRIYFRNDTCSNASEFTTFMTNNNAIVYYPLATPTYTKIEGTLKDELDAVWRASSYKGQTNISQINNDLPFELNVSVKVGS